MLSRLGPFSAAFAERFGFVKGHLSVQVVDRNIWANRLQCFDPSVSLSSTNAAPYFSAKSLHSDFVGVDAQLDVCWGK